MHPISFTSQVSKVGKHLFNTSPPYNVSEMPEMHFSKSETVDFPNSRKEGLKNTEPDICL